MKRFFTTQAGHIRFGWRVREDLYLPKPFMDAGGQVVNVDSCADDQHEWLLGTSFDDFLHRWVHLALIGPENWQWSPLCDPEKGLQPEGENALALRALLGLS